MVNVITGETNKFVEFSFLLQSPVAINNQHIDMF